MLEPIVAFFERLISDFSWRRLLFVLTLVGVTIAGLWMYETYTASFRLARMEKEISLLERLAALSERAPISKDPALRSVYTGLQGKLSSGAASSESLAVFSPAAKKSLAAASAWFLLALLVFLAGRSGTAASGFTGATAVGMVIFATPFVVLAAFLPTFEASWINYLLYPIGHVAVVVAVVLLWQRRRQSRTTLIELPNNGGQTDAQKAARG